MRWLATIALAVIGGFAGAAAWDFSGLGGHATRDYLYAHPEVLPEAMGRYQANQRQAQLAPVRDQLQTPFPGAVLGNPQGKLTRMGLAAAQQGKFAAFHDAMYALGPPSKATIEQAARQAGVDLAAADKAIASGLYDSFLKANIALASRIGIDGTPGWVIGDRIIDGAVGSAALGDAIAEARRS